MLTFILLSGASPFLDEDEDDQKTMANVSMSKYDFDYEEFDCVSSDAKVQPYQAHVTGFLLQLRQAHYSEPTSANCKADCQDS